MRQFIPENNTVLCVKIADERETAESGGFEYVKEALPLYRIERSALSSDEFKPGDVIAVDSTGTAVCDGERRYYIFKFDNIAAKIEI